MPHTLVMGNLLSTDQSTLYLDANSGFDVNLPITVVAVVATRLGNDIVFKDLGPSAVLSNFSVPQKVFGDAPFTLTAPTTNSTGAFTYTSSNPAVATVSGTTVTIVGVVGTTTITATQAATATYASNSISATFTVLILPTLSNFSVPQKYVGDAPFTLTAPTSNSTGAFTYTSSNPAVATISGSTVTIVGVGITTITATQAATATYASNSITATFTVEPNWNQRGQDIDGEVTFYPVSGMSVSVSSDGNVVAIGAPANDGNGNDVGHVRVYAWNGTAWVQRGQDIDAEAAGDDSGRSVSISSDGNVVAIGASSNDGNGNNSGQVRVYTWNGNAWVQRGQDIDGESADDYSHSVSISSNGTVVAIGALYNGRGSAYYAGHVRVYAWNGTAWVQRGLDIDGETTHNRSGESVSISSDGNVVAIGAPHNKNVNGFLAGQVRVYAWNGTAWVQRGQDIDGEAADDQSGKSVSISSDGTVVAIGAYTNDGNGNNAGHVRVYAWNGTAWVKRGKDIDGEAAFDESGTSVSISSDGNVVAIGAPYNSNNGNRVGHVRVYYYS